ncbi:MAG: helicase-associated domain-containing protein [Chloroflexota bacterium]
MPDLISSLQGSDLGLLRIIAERRGIVFNAPDAHIGLQRLIPQLLNRENLNEVLDSLPSEVRAALDDLIENEGRLPWSFFIRRYGEIRQMGAGKRDRERPDLNPISTTEVLWYRALIARSSFDSSEGLTEYAYIPDDIIAFLPTSERGTTIILGRQATPTECSYKQIVSGEILNDACTLLAATRIGLVPSEYQLHTSPSLIRAILTNTGILSIDEILDADKTRRFLEANRNEALAGMTQAWMHSNIHDLGMISSLVLEGEWEYNPHKARQAIIDFLSRVPRETWWSIPAWIASIRQRYPDFQRPSGDYISWYIRDTKSGEFLSGFEHWDDVDGVFLRYMLTGPLHWLGIVDIAGPEENVQPTSFRLSRLSEDLLHGKTPHGLSLEDDAIIVKSDAHILVTNKTPRSVRYQVARFTVWEKEKQGVYNYRITPKSLLRASHQGLTINHLLVLLNRHAKNIPPSLVKALKRWEERGTEVKIQTVTILRLSNTDILQSLNNSRAAQFFSEALNQKDVIINNDGETKVLELLAEMGYLGELEN